MSSPPLNIVYIVVHDLGRHLGCYGIPVASPHLDAFAARGCRFTQAYCSATACSPSRACAMTGDYSHVNGTVGLAHMGWALPERRRTVVDDLNAAGFLTAHFGLSHDRHPLRNHYQIDTERNWEDRYNTRRAFDHALGLLQRWRPGDQPFYCNIGLADTHPSMWSGERPYPRHGRAVPPDQVYVPPYLPDTPRQRSQLGKFQAAIRYLDAECGRFFRAAERTAAAARTVFVFTTDHGAATGWNRDKPTCYGKGVEIALLVRAPGAPAGMVVDHLIPNIDFAATVLDWAGQRPVANRAGRSFAALFRGQPYDPRTHLFIERNFHGKNRPRGPGHWNHFDPVRCVRTRDFHYMVNYRPEATSYFALPFALPVDFCDEPGQPRPLRPRPAEELYHLSTDPLELFNVADRPEFELEKLRLRALLHRWMRETDDFLLSKRVPRPRERHGFGGWKPIDTMASGKRQAQVIPTPE